MKLQEFLESDTVQIIMKYEDILTPAILKNLLPILKELDEFKGKTITIVDSTNYEDSKGEVQTTYAYKLGDESIFGEEIVLYSIFKSPPVYNNDLSKILEAAKAKGAILTPLLFNGHSLVKNVLLEFDPKTLEDSKVLERKKLHDLLDTVLDNQENYLASEERHFIIRGKLN